MEQKRFLGMPMGWDVKALSPKNIASRLWSQDDDRVLLPRRFGIGWSVNFRALARRLHLFRGA